MPQRHALTQALRGREALAAPPPLARMRSYDGDGDRGIVNEVSGNGTYEEAVEAIQEVQPSKISKKLHGY